MNLDNQKKKNINLLSIGYSCAALIILFMLFQPVSIWLENQLLEQAKNQISKEIDLYGISLAKSINNRLSLISGVTAFLETELEINQTIDEAEIAEYSARIHKSTAGILDIAIAPLGVMKYVYPYEPNKAVIGYEPAKDERQSVRDDVQRAIETRDVIMSLPIDLIQGGHGIIAREAIFIDNVYWGLANIVMANSFIYEDAGLVPVPEDLILVLSDQNGSVFFGDEKIFENSPVTYNIPLPEGHWEISGMPSGGWESIYEGTLKNYYYLGYSIIFLLSGILYLISSRQSDLQSLVDERTQQMVETNILLERDNKRRKQAEDDYNKLFNLSIDGYAVYKGTGEVIRSNPAYAEMLGYSVEEIKILNWNQLSPANWIDWELEHQIEKVFTNGYSDLYEKLYIRKDGSKFPVEVQSFLLNKATTQEDMILGVFAKDISDRIGTEEALRASENRLRTLTEATFEGIEITKNKIIIDVNQQFELMMGYDRKEMLGMNTELLVYPSDLSKFQDKLASGSEETYEIRGIKKNKEIVCLEIRPRNTVVNNETIRIASVRDVTKRIQIEKTLRHLATHDSLTGLPNKELLNDRMNHAISFGKRNEKIVAIVFMDIDNFKAVNDAFGHRQGDYLLQEIGNRLVANTRESDTVARFGGDEFVLVLENINNLNEIVVVVENLISSVTDSLTIDEVEIALTISVGISTYPLDGKKSDPLLQNADRAMYNIKKSGKNNYQFFSPEMNIEALKLLRIRNELRQAIPNNQFVLHYQPQVNSKTGEIVGVEALIRWQHPTRGLMLPEAFIDQISGSGLGIELGMWVLSTACKQMESWSEKGLPLPRLAVNISASQIQNSAMASEIKEVLETSNLSPDLLELELTENIVFQDLEFALPVLEELKEVGVRIAVDDFGTGYSTLSYLSKFPFNTLKIDRYFAQHIIDSPNDAAIVNGIVTIANSLKLDVIGEGIENSDQLECYARMGCNIIQGYVYHKPLPAEEIEILLREMQ